MSRIKAEAATLLPTSQLPFPLDLRPMVVAASSQNLPDETSSSSFLHNPTAAVPSTRMGLLNRRIMTRFATKLRHALARQQDQAYERLLAKCVEDQLAEGGGDDDLTFLDDLIKQENVTTTTAAAARASDRVNFLGDAEIPSQTVQDELRNNDAVVVGGSEDGGGELERMEDRKGISFSSMTLQELLEYRRKTKREAEGKEEHWTSDEGEGNAPPLIENARRIDTMNEEADEQALLEALFPLSLISSEVQLGLTHQLLDVWHEMLRALECEASPRPKLPRKEGDPTATTADASDSSRPIVIEASTVVPYFSVDNAIPAALRRVLSSSEQRLAVPRTSHADQQTSPSATSASSARDEPVDDAYAWIRSYALLFAEMDRNKKKREQAPSTSKTTTLSDAFFALMENCRNSGGGSRASETLRPADKAIAGAKQAVRHHDDNCAGASPLRHPQDQRLGSTKLLPNTSVEELSNVRPQLLVTKYRTTSFDCHIPEFDDPSMFEWATLVVAEQKAEQEPPLPSPVASAAAAAGSAGEQKDDLAEYLWPSEEWENEHVTASFVAKADVRADRTAHSIGRSRRTRRLRLFLRADAHHPHAAATTTNQQRGKKRPRTELEAHDAPRAMTNASEDDDRDSNEGDSSWSDGGVVAVERRRGGVEEGVAKGSNSVSLQQQQRRQQQHRLLKANVVRLPYSTSVVWGRFVGQGEFFAGDLRLEQ